MMRVKEKSKIEVLLFDIFEDFALDGGVLGERLRPLESIGGYLLNDLCADLPMMGPAMLKLIDDERSQRYVIENVPKF